MSASRRAQSQGRRGGKEPGRASVLSPEVILRWADAFRRRHGCWPDKRSGTIPEAPGETWGRVNTALYEGLRRLPLGGSLADLLARHRGKRNLTSLPPLTEEQILDWADLHHARTGTWPRLHSGTIAEAPGQTWLGVHQALYGGGRGLPGGSSLARLLARRRDAPYRPDRPRLSRRTILEWIDAYRERIGLWPNIDSGPVEEAPEETWSGINAALRYGYRGLRAGSSLARLLHRHRGVRNTADLAPLSEDQIVRWAKEYHRKHGRWPQPESGRIPRTGGETWCCVDAALSQGKRGLPGGLSLARLLAEGGLKRNKSSLPELTYGKILRWADRHHEETGDWPTNRSGRIRHTRYETWRAVDRDLLHGWRGLPGGSSLARLLFERRGARKNRHLPSFTLTQILGWADTHHTRTGHWPRADSGPIPEAPGENWLKVNQALRTGCRGLPGDSSLPRLLAQLRGVRNRAALAPYTVEQILAWADAHHVRTGEWPRKYSGAIPEVPGENWAKVDAALKKGRRGLPGGSWLGRLLRERRGTLNGIERPRLETSRIWEWARAHRDHTGRWPTQGSGEILEAPGETWGKVNRALYQGLRGLPGGSSLAQLLAGG